MEKLLNKLERKFGRFAIPNLMYYITILYVLGFVLSLFPNQLYYQFLSLDVAAILRGQIWRVLTFIVQPPAANPIFIIFALLLYYMIGRELEHTWGTFRFNVYYFTGVLLHIIAAFLVYAVTGVSLSMGTLYLNLSLYLAYAAVYPNQQFYLFGIVPIKVKYLAWIEAVYFGWEILKAFLPAYGGSVVGIYYKANALAAVVSLLNFLLFLGTSRNARRFSPKEVKRRRTYQKAVQVGREVRNTANGAKHRCAVCGRTELDDPNLEFRYCSKCNGNYEYCQDHLFTHEHVK